jgi:hypothetical protein
MTSELERHLSRLPPDDPVRPLAQLAAESEEPALLAAVVRKLLLELHAERTGPRARGAVTGREATRGSGQP